MTNREVVGLIRKPLITYDKTRRGSKFPSKVIVLTPTFEDMYLTRRTFNIDYINGTRVVMLDLPRFLGLIKQGNFDFIDLLFNSDFEFAPNTPSNVIKAYTKFTLAKDKIVELNIDAICLRAAVDLNNAKEFICKLEPHAINLEPYPEVRGTILIEHGWDKRMIDEATAVNPHKDKDYESKYSVYYALKVADFVTKYINANSLLDTKLEEVDYQFDKLDFTLSTEESKKEIATICNEYSNKLHAVFLYLKNHRGNALDLIEELEIDIAKSILNIN
ncbi:hypothetical protein D3C81_08000 [compost metagenome]